MHRADVRTHKRAGRRELAREVESRDRLGDEKTEGAPACSRTEWCCVQRRVGCGGRELSDEICYRLVREIVTSDDSGIEGGNALMCAKDYSSTIVRR